MTTALCADDMARKILLLVLFARNKQMSLIKHVSTGMNTSSMLGLTNTHATGLASISRYLIK